MIPRTIFYLADKRSSDEDWRAVLEQCRDLRAHLSGLVLTNAPPIPLVADPIDLSHNWGVMAEEERRSLAKRVKEVEMMTVGSDVSADIRGLMFNSTGPGGAVIDQAFHADLAFVTRQLLNNTRYGQDLLSSLLMHSGKPVLVAQNDALTSLQAKRILLAWNGEKPASRAASEAIHLFQMADHVEIICIDAVATETESGEAPGWDIANYLSRHAINVTARNIPSGGRKMSEIIQMTAVEMGAELVVMGGYGHARLRQKFFGGTTSDMISDAKLPVLMVH